jgi:HEAT repeat protein
MKTIPALALATILTLPAFALSDEPKDVDTLIRELRSVRPDRRAEAAQALGEIGPLAVPAVRSLTSALSDPDRAVQIESLLALGRIGPAARDASPELLRIFKGKDSALYAAAAAALGSIGYDAREAAPTLVQLLHHDDESVATAAALALTRVLPPDSEELGEAVPVLIKSLKSRDAHVRAEAVDALASAGRIALPALIELVKNWGKDGESAWQAAAALQMLGSQAAPAVPVLVSALSSGNERIVDQAAGALGAIGAPARSAVPPLRHLLSHKGASVRMHAASALGDIGAASAAAVDALTSLLKDPDEGVRREAAEALGKIGPEAKGSILALIAALNDSAGSVTTHAAWALSQMGPAAVEPLIASLNDKNLQHLAVVILGDMGPAAKSAAAPLAKLLVEPDLDTALGREVILTLAKFGPAADEAVPTLIDILKDEKSPLRPAAAWALGKIGARQAMFLLIQALPKDESPEMQIVAPIALLLLNPDKEAFINVAVPRLIGLLTHESSVVRHEAAATLASIGPKAAPAIGQLAVGLADADPALRSEYLSALGAIGPEAAEALSVIIPELADPDLNVRYAATYAIGKIGPAAKDAAPVLDRNLQGRDEFLKMISAWALVHVTPRRPGLAELCVGPLTRALLLPDPRVRREAAEALGLLGPAATSSVPALEKIANDPDESVRQSAALALQKIGR